MADFLYRSFGAASFPTRGTDVTSEQLYSAFDPARGVMLALFKAAINYELGHSTTSVDTASPWGITRAGTKLATALPVADTYYEVLTKEVLRKADLAFPLLALARTGGDFGESTFTEESDTCRWSLEYVLGPLNEPDGRRLGAVLQAVRNIVQIVIRDGCHPAYASGARQLESFDSLRAVSYNVGPANFGEREEGLVFHALSITLESVEEDGFLEGDATLYDGASVNLGIEGTGGVLKDVVEIRTDIPIQEPDLL